MGHVLPINGVGKDLHCFWSMAQQQTTPDGPPCFPLLSSTSRCMRLIDEDVEAVEMPSSTRSSESSRMWLPLLTRLENQSICWVILMVPPALLRRRGAPPI